MDYNDIYESYTSEILHTPDNEQYMLSNRSYSDIIRDYVVVARQYVNDEYAVSLERFLNSIVEQSDTDCEFCEYRGSRESDIDTDIDTEELEAERDELLSTVNNVINILKKYDLRFSRKFRLSRLDIEPLMKELHAIVDEFE